MDMFKILARSTNIQKSQPASTKSSDHRIPSTGLATSSPLNPINPNDSALNEKRVARGFKRKRNEVEKSRDDHISETPSFFDYSKGTNISADSTNGRIRESEQHQIVHWRKDNVGGWGSTMGREECQRMLKQHKLRVTILRDSMDYKGGNVSAQELLKKKSKRKVSKSRISPQPLTSFDILRSKYRISKRLAGNIKNQGYLEPTEVQIGSLPLLLGSSEDLRLAMGAAQGTGRYGRFDLDLLTIAATGSGKTLCFMVHLLHNLLKDRRAKRKMIPNNDLGNQVKALIIAPTHELVDQIVNEGRKLAMDTGIRVSGLRKGSKPKSSSADRHDKGIELCKRTVSDQDGQEHLTVNSSIVEADIFVSTPSMVLNAISVKNSVPHSLWNVGFLVLDEADVLLDPLFREQTLEIWGACTHPFLQVSLWSATMGSSIESLAQSFILERRHKLDLNADYHGIIRLVVGLKDTAIPNIRHQLIYTASEKGKLLALRQLLHPSAASSKDIPSLRPPFLIFSQTIPRAMALHSEILYDIPVEAGGSSRIAVLHSDLSDTARSKVMADFRNGETWILITTDVLSRGVDFRGINGVVNYDLPSTGAHYVHRVGRTGRQGREGGVAVTFYTKEDIPYMKNVVNVVAASRKAGKTSTNVGNEEQSMQRWLLKELPAISKNTRRSLKRKGLESRRATRSTTDRKEQRKMRISTKSGYDRRVENNRKGAVIGSLRRDAQNNLEKALSRDEDWGGIDN